MHSLLGDRFLKRFAEEIRRNRKQPTSKVEGQKLDADEEKATVPGISAAEEVHEKEAADSPETRQGSTTKSSEVDNG